MKNVQRNDRSEFIKVFFDLALVGLTGMKELAEAGQEVGMAKFGVESARVIHRALILDMKARGQVPEVGQWKREMRERLFPEHYLIWEERVLPYRLLAWQDADQVSNAGESGDPNESKEQP